DPGEPLVGRNFPADTGADTAHPAIGIEWTRGEAGPQHDPVHAGIAGGDAEGERVVQEARAERDAPGVRDGGRKRGGADELEEVAAQHGRSGLEGSLNDLPRSDLRKVVGLLMPHGDPIVARGPARASLAGAASGRQNWVDPRSGVPVPLLALLLALLAPTLVGAQVVRGRAVSAETGAPIPRAIVELRRGEWSARTTTSASGAFTLAADGPGRYTLRVAAIGFSPSTLDRLVVPAGTLDAGDVMLSRVAFTLPELRVDAPSAC